MRIQVVADANWEARIDVVLRALSAAGLERFFLARCYGQGLDGIVIDLICRDPKLGHKQRIRLEKKTKILYFDVMLNLDEMARLSDKERVNGAANLMNRELVSVLNKYPKVDVDRESLIADFDTWINSVLDA